MIFFPIRAGTRFSDCGFRAIVPMGDSGCFLCMTVAWAHPNGNTMVATFSCQGSARSPEDAEAYLRGEDVELAC